jgi:hypothetical protein
LKTVDTFQYRDRFPIQIILFTESHEIAIGLTSIAVMILAAILYPKILIYLILFFLFFIAKSIHPAAIGFSAMPGSSFLPALMLRGFLCGYGYSFILTDYSYASLIQPEQVQLAIACIILCMGYFVEFMNRRGFSSWIGIQCSSILSLVFFSFILDKTILTASILASIYIISLFAAYLRNFTRNSWDAVLFYFLCYIIYLHADEILIYLQSIIG